MLKNYLGKDANANVNGIGVGVSVGLGGCASGGATLTSSTDIICVRCSRGALQPRDSSNVAVACVNGHVQCLECDSSMRHQCKKCGIPTTSVLQHDDRTEPIDPKTLPPEDLTQLELNAALQQFKLNFHKFSDKKKRTRLIEATSHIIELLNPSLIDPYRKGRRYSQIQIEEHFFRSSEKTQHTFAWHKAALDFVMDRTFDLKNFNRDAGTVNAAIQNGDELLNITSYPFDPEAEAEADILCKRNLLHANKSLNFLKKYTQQQEKSFEITHHNNNNKKHKKNNNNNNNDCCYVDETGEIFDFTHTENFFLELTEGSPLIFIKPPQWLTEIMCPHCGLNVRLSEFSKHFAIYHCLPIECMQLGETRRVYLDPRVMLSRGSYPHTLFLIRNMVRDLGGSDFRNLFPIVLITATLQKDELCEQKIGRERDRTPGPRQLMIWLSSICLNNEFKVCLQIVSERNANFNHCMPLKSLYPITKSQNLNDIYQSGEFLLLPSNTFGILNRNGLERIVLEISLEERIESTA